MFPISPPSLLALVLLQGSAVLESPSAVAACEDTQRVELSLGSAATYEVCVSPGIITGLRFDAPVTLELQDEVRFEEVVRSRQLLTLVPPPDMAPGERIRLTVRFEGGATQQSATFVLVAHRGQATHQVEVYRDKRTRQSFQQEIDQEHATNEKLREENQQLRGTLEQLRARLNQSVGLMGLYLNGVLNWYGIKVTEIPLKEPKSPEDVLIMRKGICYRSNNSVAVEVFLKNSSAEPWTATGASLVTARGEKMDGVRMYQAKAIAPNDRGSVFVEAPAARREPQGEVTLTLSETTGARAISIPGVRFPE